MQKSVNSAKVRRLNINSAILFYLFLISPSCSWCPPSSQWWCSHSLSPWQPSPCSWQQWWSSHSSSGSSQSQPQSRLHGFPALTIVQQGHTLDFLEGTFLEGFNTFDFFSPFHVSSSMSLSEVDPLSTSFGLSSWVAPSILTSTASSSSSSSFSSSVVPFTGVVSSTCY